MEIENEKDWREKYYLNEYYISHDSRTVYKFISDILEKEKENNGESN